MKTERARRVALKGTTMTAKIVKRAAMMMKMSLSKVV